MPDGATPSSPVPPLAIMSLQAGTCKGGADILALDTAIRLKARGHRIVWACVPDCALIGKAEEAGFKIFPIQRKFSLGQCFRLIGFCRGERIDVINAQDSRSRHLAAVSRLLGLSSRVVFTRHCIPGFAPVIGAFQDWIGADFTIAVSNAVKDALRAGRLPASRMAMIYGSIDIARFDQVGPEKIERLKNLYCRRNTLNIGMVARFHKDSVRPGRPSAKSHEVLFRALSRIKEDFKLIAVGCDDDARESLKELALKSGLDTGKLAICGFEPDIAPFYKIFDISVLPSPAEGLGLVVAEAMAAGSAAVAANSGGAAEIITDGVDGLLFEPGNEADLASKIRLLMNDPVLRKTFIENSRHKVRELFDINKNSLETEKILARVAGNRRPDTIFS